MSKQFKLAYRIVPETLPFLSTKNLDGAFEQNDNGKQLPCCEEANYLEVFPLPTYDRLVLMKYG